MHETEREVSVNVKQLRELLMDMDDDLPILVSSDPEGNYFDTLGAIDDGCVFVKQGREYEIYCEEVEDVPEGATPCLIIWP